MSGYDLASIVLVIAIAIVFIRRQRPERRPRQGGQWSNNGDEGSVTPMKTGAMAPTFDNGRRRGDEGGDGYAVDSGPGHSHGSTGSRGHGDGAGGDGGGGDGGGD